MAIPLALSTTALLAGLACLHQRIGRWGVVTAILGLSAVWIILGWEGFEYLF